MALRPVSQILATRAVQAASVRTATRSIPENDLTVEQKNFIYPKIGTREIVGFGMNGSPSYMDNDMYPYPAIRFREETSEITALRKKEQGDWKQLSREEKRALYRHSFCQTFAEMDAPTGEWKSILAGVLVGCSLTLWGYWFMKKFVYPPMPHTISEEWQKAEVEHMIRQNQGRITGLASMWDYENNRWKK